MKPCELRTCGLLSWLLLIEQVLLPALRIGSKQARQLLLGGHKVPQQAASVAVGAVQVALVLLLVLLGCTRSHTRCTCPISLVTHMATWPNKNTLGFPPRWKERHPQGKLAK